MLPRSSSSIVIVPAMTGRLVAVAPQCACCPARPTRCSTRGSGRRGGWRRPSARASRRRRAASARTPTADRWRAARPSCAGPARARAWRCVGSGPPRRPAAAPPPPACPAASRCTRTCAWLRPTRYNGVLELLVAIQGPTRDCVSRCTSASSDWTKAVEFGSNGVVAGSRVFQTLVGAKSGLRGRGGTGGDRARGGGHGAAGGDDRQCRAAGLESEHEQHDHGGQRRDPEAGRREQRVAPCLLGGGRRHGHHAP